MLVSSSRTFWAAWNVLHSLLDNSVVTAHLDVPCFSACEMYTVITDKRVHAGTDQNICGESLLLFEQPNEPSWRCCSNGPEQVPADGLHEPARPPPHTPLPWPAASPHAGQCPCALLWHAACGCCSLAIHCSCRFTAYNAWRVFACMYQS